MKTSLSFIGFMGSGKTNVGKKVSFLLKIPFLDLDEYIEKKLETSIYKIFEEKGEEYFRSLETSALKEIFSLFPEVVLSTGGGIVLREENRKILKERSKVIYLKGSFENLMRNLEKEEEFRKRPLLKKSREELLNLWKSRLPLYEECADIILSVDNKNIDEITHEVIERLKNDKSISLKWS
ncbi:MAG: shikimate kinase [Dictyoglomaceae bacterium]